MRAFLGASNTTAALKHRCQAAGLQAAGHWPASTTAAANHRLVRAARTPSAIYAKSARMATQQQPGGGEQNKKFTVCASP
jgi:hypothetical protein